MISINLQSSEEISGQLAARVRARRLQQNLTMAGLANRAGVALGTLKKFERSGKVSLQSFIKLIVALRAEADLAGLLAERQFETLEQVLQSEKPSKRGRIN